MTNWLQYTNQSNKLKQTYLTGFFDVSGGDIINRTGDLYVYGNSYLNTNLKVNGQTEVTGKTVLSSSVCISGDLSMNGNISLPSGDLQTMLTNIFTYITVLDTSYNVLNNHYQTLQSEFMLVHAKMALVNNIISDFTHIQASGIYDLSSNIKYIVELDCILNLPENSLEGSTIIVVNNANDLIQVNSVESMYNTSYLPYGGNMIYVHKNATAYMTYVKNQTTQVNSWNVLMF